MTLNVNTFYCLQYDADPYSSASAISLTYCNEVEEQNFNFDQGSIITPSSESCPFFVVIRPGADQSAEQCVAVNTTLLTDSPTNGQGFPAIQHYLYVNNCAERDAEQQWTAVDY